MNNYFMISKRLGFKNWTIDDYHLAFTLWSNQEVSKYISINGQFSEKQIKDRFYLELNNMEKYKVAYWPIFLLDNDVFIGVCGLRPYDLDNNIYEIGVHLIDDYWHQGYAQEALLKTIEYAFNVLKVNNLNAGHNPHNIRSKKMLEEIGFKYLKDEYYEPTGLMHPSYLYKNND
ncbi:MAG: GNAT family N-acetyltransferase [Bacilli bacterium]|jgi:RimJ/RimL family protein N-acetyltransferase|nr:GNAT family N-acetyltransferase [Bacilli bacterium]